MRIIAFILSKEKIIKSVTVGVKDLHNAKFSKI